MKQKIRRWSLVVFLIVVSFVLGIVGFLKLFKESGQPYNSGDAVYLSAQLFFLESGFVEGPINTELQIARYLAPVASAYAIVQTVVVVFSRQMQRAWLRLFGGHVIVCGLGHKGARLVEQLRLQRKRVVVIEPDEQNHDLSHCRGLGAVVLVGRVNSRMNSIAKPRATRPLPAAAREFTSVGRNTLIGSTRTRPATVRRRSCWARHAPLERAVGDDTYARSQRAGGFGTGGVKWFMIPSGSLMTRRFANAGYNLHSRR